MKVLLKTIVPILVVAAAGWGAYAIVKSKPNVKTQRPEIPPPLVQVMVVKMEDHTFTVDSQGTVAPRTESQLVPEVAGRVIEVSPSFETGGFFEEGEVLLKIDPHDYRQAWIRVQGDVAARKLGLAREEAEAAVALKEWRELHGEEPASPLTLRQPYLEDARAALAAAKAALDQAERNLERTEVRAPYAGRVREKLVDLGRYVTPGTVAALIYAVDFAEVRLPLPDSELAYLDLPLDYRGEKSAEDQGPKVRLYATFAGKEHCWEGRVVRTEGEIDPDSRMVHAVARVKDPYSRGNDPSRPPLAVGMYVRARIEGTTVHGVAELPRAALHGSNRVLIVDPEDRLRYREVSILRATRDHVVVQGGLEAGESVCLTPLEAITDGMRVRVLDEESDSGMAAAEGKIR